MFASVLFIGLRSCLSFYIIIIQDDSGKINGFPAADRKTVVLPKGSGSDLKCVGCADTHKPPLPKQRGFAGTPDATRTHDLLLRRQTLYPTELQAHLYSGAPPEAAPQL